MQLHQHSERDDTTPSSLNGASKFSSSRTDRALGSHSSCHVPCSFPATHLPRSFEVLCYTSCMLTCNKTLPCHTPYSQILGALKLPRAFLAHLRRLAAATHLPHSGRQHLSGPQLAMAHHVVGECLSGVASCREEGTSEGEKQGGGVNVREASLPQPGRRARRLLLLCNLRPQDMFVSGQCA